MLSEIEDSLLRSISGKPVHRPSIVRLYSNNGYDHIVDCLRPGDSVYLVGVDGTPFLRIDWDNVTGRFAVTLAALPESDKYVVYPGNKIELPK